jgi:hypothetical protein
MVQIVAVSSLPVTTPHKPHHTRRAGSIHSVEMMIDSAREKYAKRDGLSIMTEFISIKPLTLRFSKVSMLPNHVPEQDPHLYLSYELRSELKNNLYMSIRNDTIHAIAPL